MRDPAEIAAGLSEAQKRALRERRSTWTGRSTPHSCWMTVGRPMLALGLIEFVGSRSTATRLTPLGEAVAAIRKEKGR